MAPSSENRGETAQATQISAGRSAEATRGDAIRATERIDQLLLVLLGALALLQPGLVALGLDDFHDVTLGVPLALGLALALERRVATPRLLLVALAVALLADEVYPLVVAGAAGWALVERGRRDALLL